jgi:hypothetical protein
MRLLSPIPLHFSAGRLLILTAFLFFISQGWSSCGVSKRVQKIGAPALEDNWPGRNADRAALFRCHRQLNHADVQLQESSGQEMMRCS